MRGWINRCQFKTINIRKIAERHSVSRFFLKFKNQVHAGLDGKWIINMDTNKKLATKSDSLIINHRNSNIELYRIICMIMIIAHHFVVNSGLTEGPMSESPTSLSSLYLSFFGMWGKTAINCFLMITGYYMCTKTISIRKFLKLILEVYFYSIIINILFHLFGVEQFSWGILAYLIFPFFGDFGSNFVTCFLVFYFFIPFWNIFIHSISIRQHQLVLLLSLGVYSIIGNIPYVDMHINYIVWFGIIYLLSAYIRLHPSRLSESRHFWGILTIISILLSICSVLTMSLLFKKGRFFFVADSNKLLAVVVALSSFNWFRNLKLPYNKFINALGAATFGVLIIHANSDAMRKMLWGNIVDCVGHYSLPLPSLIIYSIASVVLIYFSCSIIDIIRKKIIEEPVLHLLDRKFSTYNYW